MTSEIITTTDGTSLCLDAVGPTDGPAVLLLAGGTQSMDWWDPALCARLADHGRLVIRLDTRDTGESSASPEGQPGYTASDLALDVHAVLDHLDVSRAHLVGLSLGSGTALLAAQQQPSRCLSLLLMGASPPGGSGGELPGPAAALAPLLSDPPPDPDWADRDASIRFIVEEERPFAGPDAFDEAWVRRTAAIALHRRPDQRAARTNHFMLEPGAQPSTGLGDLTTPTLVLHGSHDPLFPPEHGRALAQALPSGRFELFEGLGHQQPPPKRWNEFIERVLHHTSSRA